MYGKQTLLFFLPRLHQEIHETIMAAHLMPQKSCHVASSSVCHQDISFAYTLQIDNRNTTKTHCMVCDSNFFVTMEELSSTDPEKSSS